MLRGKKEEKYPTVHTLTFVYWEQVEAASGACVNLDLSRLFNIHALLRARHPVT